MLLISKKLGLPLDWLEDACSVLQAKGYIVLKAGKKEQDILKNKIYPCHSSQNLSISKTYDEIVGSGFLYSSKNHQELEKDRYFSQLKDLLSELKPKSEKSLRELLVTAENI